METKQTMMMRASITAYSTAVGPSSLTRKRLTLWKNLFMGTLLQKSDEVEPKTRSVRRTHMPSHPNMCFHRATSVAGLRTAASRQLPSHGFSHLIGVGADRLNGNQADDDDQRQHDGIFHRGRAVFRDQK